MNHGSGYRKLNRTHEHRKALWANMAGALIEHEQIKDPRKRKSCAHREKITRLATRRPACAPSGGRTAETGRQLRNVWRACRATKTATGLRAWY